MPDHIVYSDSPSTTVGTFLSERQYSKVVVLTDENTFKYCYPTVKSGLPEHEVITIVPGEEHKTIGTCISIWTDLTRFQVDRHSVVIILGGGVLGDMGGFCAATFKRGVDFILIPTTLLAQVDSSIGGKLGIDFQHLKNHIGIFQFPVLTVLYEGFLKTLPENEMRSGFAEIIKHTLISDNEMWESIKGKTLQEQNWSTLIQHSVAFKSSVAEKDPQEKGLRKILNAGHTIGHAIETYLLHAGRKIMHGEAVAAGLVMESFIACERNLIAQSELKQICVYIDSIFKRILITEHEFSAIIKLMLQDKKNRDNKILCVLPEGIGKAGWDYEISVEEVKRALSFYLSA